MGMREGSGGEDLGELEAPAARWTPAMWAVRLVAVAVGARGRALEGWEKPYLILLECLGLAQQGPIVNF